jgi:centromere protein S
LHKKHNENKVTFFDLNTMEAPESTSTGVSRPTGANSSVDSELRAAVQYAVIQLCSEDDENSSSRMSSRAIAALAELTCLYATHSLAADLESFSSHAGRRTINEADVKLAARKIPDALLQRLNNFCDNHCTSNNNDNSSKRPAKKKAATVDLQGTKHKDFAYDVASDSSSSSDEDITMKLDRPASRRVAPVPVPVRKPAHDSLSDSDSDDELQILGSLQSRLKNRKATAVKSADADPLDTSDEDSKPRAATAAAAPPNRRFRLQATKLNDDNMTTDTEDDDDDDILKDPFAKAKVAGGSATKDSLVRKILEDMDDDSVLSENAEKENDTYE